MIDICRTLRDFDEIDRRIVALLQQDARRPLQEVGARVGLTAPTVKRRLSRLQEGGVVRGYTAVVDARRFGWSTLAITELKTEGSFSGRMVLEEIRRHPEVSGGWTVAGAASDTTNGDSSSMLPIFNSETLSP